MVLEVSGEFPCPGCSKGMHSTERGGRCSSVHVASSETTETQL